MSKNHLFNEEIQSIYHQNIKFLMDNLPQEIISKSSLPSIQKQIVDGSIKLNDIIELNSLLKKFNISNIKSYLEIGSYVGFSFYMFMSILQPDIGVSIDPNIKHRIFHSPRDMFIKLNNKFLVNNKAKYLNGFFAGTSYPSPVIYTRKDFDQKFDCIFIDGEHDYKSVQRDFLEAQHLLNTDGIIILHDIYTWGGVEKFCIDLDYHYDWYIIRTPKLKSTDGFAVVQRTRK